MQTHQWSEETIKTIIRPNWHVKNGIVERKIEMIVTPRVIKEVRAHFNCDELEGAELEDQGGDGTALTHWEKRVFEVSLLFIKKKKKMIIVNNKIFHINKSLEITIE